MRPEETISFTQAIRFDGKVAFVAGAGAGGIGTHTALTLAELGADIVALDRSEKLVRETEEVVTGMGRRCVSVVADLRDRTAVRTAVETAVAEAGAIHCLATVAGGMQQGQWYRGDECPDDAYDAVMSLNMDYVFLMCRDVARHMIDAGIPGSIVNFASVSALAGAPYHAAYGAAKAGVAALTRSFAVEWGPLGIRVNAVAPGSIRTPRNVAAGGADEHAQTWNPIGRQPEAHEVAAAVAFLLSDAAAAISGQVLSVDGGATARSPFGGIERFAGRSPA